MMKARLKVGLKAALALACLGAAWFWLLRHADLSALWARAPLVPTWGWLLAALGLVGGHAMRALRLRQEWRSRGHASFATCLRIVLTHNAAVLLLPLRSGEAGYVLLVQRQWGVPWREAAARLFWWRVQDVAVLATLSALLLLPWPPAARMLAVLSLVFAALPFVPAQWSWHGLAASAGNWCLKLLANGGLLLALTGLDPLTALRAALGGELGGVQPLQGPAGLGSYEAGVWLAAQLPPEQQPLMVAAALTVHAWSLLVAIGAAGLFQLGALRSRAPSTPLDPLA